MSLRNTLCSETLWDTLKTQISKKNGVLKSIVHVIKHANYLENQTMDNKLTNKRVLFFVHQTMCLSKTC